MLSPIEPRGKDRALRRACSRASQSDGGYHYRRWYRSGPGCKKGYEHYPDKRRRPAPILLETDLSLVWRGRGAMSLGLTNVGGELGGKLLELLKEVVPKLNRVAVLMRGAGSPANELFVKETELSARKMGIQLIPLAFRVTGGCRGGVSICSQKASQWFYRTDRDWWFYNSL